MTERIDDQVWQRYRTLLAALLIGWAVHGVAVAGKTRPVATEPDLDQRVHELAAELRCLVCQNQSLAESNAPLARDIRHRIRDQLAQGRTESEIREFLVTRYGDFILYRPPWKATTVLLWISPVLLLLGGLGWLLRGLARRGCKVRSPPLDAGQRELAERLLIDSDPERGTRP